MDSFKGYVYVVFSSAVMLAATVFTALQWGGQSTFSAYGPDVTTRTIWLVLGSAGGGVVVYGMGRIMIRGVRILWKLRRARQQVRSELRRAESKAHGQRD